MMRLTKKQMDYYTEAATREANTTGPTTLASSVAKSNLVIIELLYRILETQNNIDRKE